MKDLYPEALVPTTSDKYEIRGRLLEVPQTVLAFRQWTGQPIENTFGGKPLVDFDGKPVFAELAIQKTAEAGGWSSRWVETYAMKGGIPYFFISWLDGPLNKQVVEPIADMEQNELLAEIAKHNGNSYYGCWDIIAWKDGRTLFLESKRTKKDRVRDTQLRWLDAGLKAGLLLDNFLIVQWDFTQ